VHPVQIEIEVVVFAKIVEDWFTFVLTDKDQLTFMDEVAVVVGQESQRLLQVVQPSAVEPNNE